ncbi:phospholipase A2 [Lipomyces japonicus]|uniref:phospholipase A2 n=1 Tax=Lipomyces japonicus TaxID=56871 RepID=UPI0034CFD43A
MDSNQELTRLLKSAIRLHHDLSPNFVPVVNTVPTAVQFLRQVNSNQPIVYAASAFQWPALDANSDHRWSRKYLLSAMKDAIIPVTETPLGNADAPLDGKVFVQPHMSLMKFEDFMCKLLDPNDSTVYYMQSQNNNMATEFPQLADDVEMGIPWASEALGSNPEAVNIWIGGGESITSLHKDHYENLHVQILGKKIFKLIAPVEHICVKETMLEQATYVKTDCGFEIKRDEEAGKVPWPTMDPDGNSRDHIDKKDKDEWGQNCRILEVVLNPGDILYLPALWYHKVSQVADDDGLCCSVNLWYDMDFSGPLWPYMNFVRNFSRHLVGEKEFKDLDDL